MDQKAVALSKNEGDYLYQFHDKPFDKEEDGEDGELLFLQFSVCHCGGPLRVLSGIKP